MICNKDCILYHQCQFIKKIVNMWDIAIFFVFLLSLKCFYSELITPQGNIIAHEGKFCIYCRDDVSAVSGSAI